MKYAYDSRTVVRAGIAPVIPSAYCYHRSSKEKPVSETQKNLPHHTKQLPNCGMAAKLASDAAINTDNNPFYMTRAAVAKVDHAQDRDVRQTKAPYGGVGVAGAAATNGNVGSVQYGMARMY